MPDENKSREPSSLDLSIESWLEEGEILGDSLRCKIYRVAAGKNVLIDEIHEMPSEGDIARKFGAGTFKILINAKNKSNEWKNTSRTINIGEEFGRTAQVNNQPEQMQYPQFPPHFYQPRPFDAESFLKVATGLAGALTPLVAAFTANRQPPKDNFNVNEMMKKQIEMFGGFQEVMQQNAFDTLERNDEMIRMAMEMKRERNEMENTQEQNKSLGHTLFEQFAPLIQQFLPTILGKGPAATIAKTALTGSKEFQELKQDPEAMADFMADFTEEHGAEAAAQLAEIVEAE